VLAVVVLVWSGVPVWHAVGIGILLGLLLLIVWLVYRATGVGGPTT
jgi:hypothetical protein